MKPKGLEAALNRIAELERQLAERGEAVEAWEKEGTFFCPICSHPVFIPALEALHASQVPEGMALVPTEITTEMISAWQSAFSAQLNRRMNGSKKKFAAGVIESCEVVAYRAMLAAAPQIGAKP